MCWYKKNLKIKNFILIYFLIKNTLKLPLQFQISFKLMKWVGGGGGGLWNSDSLWDLLCSENKIKMKKVKSGLILNCINYKYTKKIVFFLIKIAWL
jgi:hypothetical protein